VGIPRLIASFLHSGTAGKGLLLNKSNKDSHIIS